MKLTSARSKVTEKLFRTQMSSSLSSSTTYVMRHPGHCTGMYWRADPMKGKSSFPGPPDWPRNGALLKGDIKEFVEKPENSLKWLEVSEYKQRGSEEWVKTPNCWMQFDQGGTLLHEQK
jgi:hypothetical protein